MISSHKYMKRMKETMKISSFQHLLALVSLRAVSLISTMLILYNKTMIKL